MKSILAFLFIFTFLTFQVFTQSINQKDANGRKTGKWIIYQKGTKIKFEEGNFVNGRKEGLWKRYKADGVNLKIEAHYMYKFITFGH